MSPNYPIRTITLDEFDAFTAVPGHAFLDDWPAEDRELERPVIEFDRTIAAFDGTQMVGTAGAYTFRMTVPGGTADVAGVTLVSVLPSHRRRGILTDMMRYVIADAGRRDEAIAILYASESGIYGRFGFGLATWHQRIRVRSGDGRLSIGTTAPASPQLCLRLANPSDVRSDLAKVFATVLPTRPGMLARSEAWWDLIVSDAPTRRDGMSALRCLLAEDASGVRGYALYRTKGSWSDGLPDGELRLQELTALDPAATAALWTDLFSRDLVSAVYAVHRPVDDPLLAMLADPRRALPLVGDALWVRLMDVPAALIQRKYASAIDVVLDVQDAFMPENAGRWRLTSGGLDGGGDTHCERTTAPADLLISVHALGAGYLGGASFGQLASAGHVSELIPGALARLAAAMSWDQRPWCSMMF